MSRHKAREVALQMLFQMMMGGNDRRTAGYTLEAAGLSAEAAAFAALLTDGAWEKRFEADEYIKKFTDGWQLERLFAVDRLLLWLAIYELKYCGEAPAVVIDEAVELAKAFGTDSSAAFVNAVLDNFRDKVLVQKLAEYEPDAGAVARAAEHAEQLRAAAVPKPEPPAPRAERPMPITEQMGKRSFRKIAKAEQTAADKILPEPEDEDDWRAKPGR